MKIAFDENMPAAMVRTFQALAGEKRFQKLLSGCVVVSAKDYTPRLYRDGYHLTAAALRVVSGG